MVFQRPKSESEAEENVDLLITERMSEDEIEEVASHIAPNKQSLAVELIAEMQVNPMISEPVVEYYSRRILALAA